MLTALEVELIVACKELFKYIRADNELKVIMYPQSLDYAEETIQRAEAQSIRGGK